MDISIYPFYEFVVNHLKRANSEKDMANRIGLQEIFLGDVIQAAIDNKLNLNSLIFTEGSFIDIGTPDDLARAVQIHFNRKA